jgi:hypothetical protein
LPSAVANPATLVECYNRYPISYPIAFACVIAMELLWIWLIARKRKNWARWISLVVVLVGIPSTIWGFDERFRVNAAATVILCASFGRSMISVFLLFRRDASEWLAGRPVVPDLDQLS